MEPMETVQEAVARLATQGFADSFRAEGGGLRALEAKRLFAPEDLVAEEVNRFEGASNPDDQAIVFALRSPTGVRGTWVVPYGAHVDPLDAACLQRLPTSREPQQGRKQ